MSHRPQTIQTRSPQAMTLSRGACWTWRRGWEDGRQISCCPYPSTPASSDTISSSLTPLICGCHSTRMSKSNRLTCSILRRVWVSHHPLRRLQSRRCLLKGRCVAIKAAGLDGLVEAAAITPPPPPLNKQVTLHHPTHGVPANTSRLLFHATSAGNGAIGQTIAPEFEPAYPPLRIPDWRLPAGAPKNQACCPTDSSHTVANLFQSRLHQKRLTSFSATLACHTIPGSRRRRRRCGDSDQIWWPPATSSSVVLFVQQFSLNRLFRSIGRLRFL